MVFPQLKAPIRVTWDITSSCNLRCVHCYNMSSVKAIGELGGQDVLKVANEIAKIKVLIVTLSGGEPLLKHELWQVIPLLKKHGIHVNLVTNGTLLTGDVAERLKDNEIDEVQVSIDGMENTHNHIRVTPEAFAKSMKGVKNLLEHGISTMISMTVFRRNVHEVADVLDLAVKLGAQRFRALRFIPMGRGEKHFKDTLSPRQVKDLTLKLVALQESYKGIIDIQLDESVAFLSEEERERYGVRWSGCLAAQSEAAIDSLGNLYPCVFLGYPEFCAGNLVESSIKELWHSDIFTTFRNINKHCADCNVTPCLGGCPAVSYAFFRDIRKGDPYCWRKNCGERNNK